MCSRLKARLSVHDMVAEITDLSRNLMLPVDIVPIPADEAVKEVEMRTCYFELEWRNLLLIHAEEVITGRRPGPVKEKQEPEKQWIRPFLQGLF